MEASTTPIDSLLYPNLWGNWLPGKPGSFLFFLLLLILATLLLGARRNPSLLYGELEWGHSNPSEGEGRQADEASRTAHALPPHLSLRLGRLLVQLQPPASCPHSMNALSSLSQALTSLLSPFSSRESLVFLFFSFFHLNPSFFCVILTFYLSLAAVSFLCCLNFSSSCSLMLSC